MFCYSFLILIFFLLACLIAFSFFLFMKQVSGQIEQTSSMASSLPFSSIQNLLNMTQILLTSQTSLLGGYCGDELCSFLTETCSNCPLDCGVCQAVISVNSATGFGPFFLSKHNNWNKGNIQKKNNNSGLPLRIRILKSLEISHLQVQRLSVNSTFQCLLKANN